MINLREKPSGVAFIEHANCADCPLACNPVAGRGNPHAQLAIVGEAPKWPDVQVRRPMSGDTERLVKLTLTEAHEDIDNVWVTNAVLCRSFAPDGEELPAPSTAIAACRPRLLAELAAVDPALIVTMGAGAAKAAFGTRVSVNEVEGVVEHVKDFPAPVLPTFHPAHILNDNVGQYDSFLSNFKRAVKLATGVMVLPDRNEHIPWKHVTTAADIAGVLTDIAQGKAGFTLAIDVETSGLSIVDSELLQVSIGNTERGVALEFSAMDAANIAQMRSLLRDERFTWIIHNMSFDRQRFEKFFGAVPAVDVDTMCLALGLTERSDRVGLKRLSREWLNAPYYESEIHAYLSNAGGEWGNIPRPVLARYAVLDTVYTARVFPILDALCREEGTHDLAHRLLMPAQRAFADFERYGVQVDRTYISTLAVEWTPKVEAARAAIQDYAAAQGWKNLVPGKAYRATETVMVAEPLYIWTNEKGEVKHSKTRGKKTPAEVEVKFVQVPKQRSVWKREMVEEPLNVNSPKQLADFLFDYLKLPPPPEGRKTGKEFRDFYPEHQFTHLHGEYALMNRMLNTYVKGISNEIASDGRVHPNFLLFGAVTGRLSIQGPALQTIPREDILESGGVRRFDSIKRLFLPSSGSVWMETDYAQLELRVGWHVSEDASFGEAIMSGDFHRLMASKIFGLPPEQITDLMRHDTKRVVFGIMYGRMAPAIAKQLGCTVETAQRYIDQFFEAAPVYHEWYKAQQRQALTSGRSTTSFGRVRRWNLITRENRQNVLNQAVNFPIQSTASDLCLTAAIKLNEWFKETGYGHVLFLVHDSINYEAREGKETIVANKVREIMTEWPFPSVAVLDVETKFGPSWGETRKWKYNAA